MNQKIGVIGLGLMGASFAKNLLNAGFKVNVYDVRPEPIKELMDLGANGAGNLKEIGENSDIVFVMVLNYPQVKSCTFEEQGVLRWMKPGSTLIVTSTIAPSEIKEVAHEALKYDVNVLDAPVTGGTKGAESGTLAIMVAGPDKVYEECKEVLLTIGSNTVKVGEEIGIGQVIKAANQLLVSVHVVAMAEAMVLGKAAGADPEIMYEVLTKGVANSAMFEDKVPRILKGDFSRTGALDIQIKDLDICAKLSKEVNVPLFTSSVSRDVYLWANGKGMGKEDLSAVIKLYEDIAGVEVRSNDVLIQK